MICNWCRTAGRRQSEGNLEEAFKLHKYCAGDCPCQHWLGGYEPADH